MNKEKEQGSPLLPDPSDSIKSDVYQKSETPTASPKLLWERLFSKKNPSREIPNDSKPKGPSSDTHNHPKSKTRLPRQNSSSSLSSSSPSSSSFADDVTETSEIAKNENDPLESKSSLSDDDPHERPTTVSSGISQSSGGSTSWSFWTSWPIIGLICKEQKLLLTFSALASTAELCCLAFSLSQIYDMYNDFEHNQDSYKDFGLKVLLPAVGGKVINFFNNLVVGKCATTKSASLAEEIADIHFSRNPQRKGGNAQLAGKLIFDSFDIIRPSLIVIYDKILYKFLEIVIYGGSLVVLEHDYDIRDVSYIAGAALGFTVLGCALAAIKVGNERVKYLKRYENLYEYIATTVGNYETVEVFGAKKKMLEDIKSKMSSFTTTVDSDTHWYSVIVGVLDIILFSGATVLAVFLSNYRDYKGEKFFYLFGYSILQSKNFKELTESFLKVMQASYSFKERKEYIKLMKNQDNETKENKIVLTTEEEKCLIEFKKVNFGRRIRDLTFSVNQGENVFIEGPSGCGKSLILKLLSGLIQPSNEYVHNVAIFREVRPDFVYKYTGREILVYKCKSTDEIYARVNHGKDNCDKPLDLRKFAKSDDALLQLLLQLNWPKDNNVIKPCQFSPEIEKSILYLSSNHEKIQKDLDNKEISDNSAAIIKISNCKKFSDRCDLYLMLEFDSNKNKCNEIKGNAVILTNENEAYFVVNGKLVTKKDDKPQVVEGIDRQGIIQCKRGEFRKIESPKEDINKIIQEAILKGGHTLSYLSDELTYIHEKTEIFPFSLEDNIKIADPNVFEKNKGYDLALMSVDKGSIRIDTILKNNEEFQGKPILFKQGDRFSIYGVSNKGKWRLTQDLIADKFTELKFEKKPYILLSNQVPQKVYEEITLKKGHTQNNPDEFVESRVSNACVKAGIYKKFKEEKENPELSTRVENYSSGQKKRVGLARFFLKADLQAGASHILLLDEPVANLDSETENTFLRHLEDLINNDQKTIFVIEHGENFKKYFDITQKALQGNHSTRKFDKIIRFHDDGEIRLLSDSKDDVIGYWDKNKSESEENKLSPDLYVLKDHKRIAVPKDSNSLFWSVTLAILLPLVQIEEEEEEEGEFYRMCGVLFGFGHTDDFSKVLKMLKNYKCDDSSEKLFSDLTFQKLIGKNLRKNVVLTMNTKLKDEIKEIAKKAGKKNWSEYREYMDKIGTWPGSELKTDAIVPEIQAISRLTKMNIKVTGSGYLNIYSPYKTYKTTETNIKTISLVHVNAERSKEVKEKHYCYGLHKDVYKKLALDNAEDETKNNVVRGISPSQPTAIGVTTSSSSSASSSNVLSQSTAIGLTAFSNSSSSSSNHVISLVSSGTNSSSSSPSSFSSS